MATATYAVRPFPRSSARAAACNQTCAICRKISRSRSDLAVFAQPKHSSAYSLYSRDDGMTRDTRPMAMFCKKVWNKIEASQDILAMRREIVRTSRRKKPRQSDRGLRRAVTMQRI